MTFAPENIPAELKALPNWIVWRLQCRDCGATPKQEHDASCTEARRPNYKPSKVPFAVLGGMAKTNDPSTWTSFDAAADRCAGGGYDGVGFVFTGTPYVGIDVDGGLGDDGTPGENTRAIVSSFPEAYVETSQSGRGVHVIVKGTLPPGGRRKGPVEAYDASSPRYFALTGNTGGWTIRPPRPIPDANGQLAAFHARWIGATVPEPELAGAKPASDDPRVAACVARAKAHSPGFSAMYNFGETRPGKSASESDSWMARELARWERDPQVLLAAMQGSALARPRWAERRPRSPTGTLIGLAIQDALDAVPLDPSVRYATAERRLGTGGSLAVLRRQKDIMTPPKPVAPRLAWEGRVTLLAGREKKSGKSTLVTAACAAVTRGGTFLGLPCPKGRVLWVSADLEPEPDAVQRAARFGAAGVRFILKYPTGNFDERLAQFEEWVVHYRPSLVVIDTLAHFALVEEASQAGGWIAAMMPIVQIARDHGPAVILVHHTPKGSPNEYRDSTAIGGAVDQILIYKNPDETMTSPKREMIGLGRVTGWKPFSVELRGDDFAIVDAPPAPDLAMRRPILAAVQATPGLNTGALKAAIKDAAPEGHRSSTALGAFIKAAAQAGLIRNSGGHGGDAWISAIDPMDANEELRP